MSGGRLMAGVVVAASWLLASEPSLAGQTSGSTDRSDSVSGPSDLDEQAAARVAAPPLGLPPVPMTADGRPTPAEVRLGRRLFLDRRLSRDGNMSCAMCHIPEQGFTNNELATAIGIEGRSLHRNAPSLLNVVYSAPFFRDGREPQLDLQPFDVFLNPHEMAAPSLGSLVETVRSLADYGPLFEQAYAGPATVALIGRALGSYERTLLAANSPFDRWYFGGETDALDAAGKRGFEVFRGKGNCVSCHTIEDDHALFTDNRFHDTGLAWHRSTVDAGSTDPVRVEIAPGRHVDVDRSAIESVGEPRPADVGRNKVTGDPAHRWQFKTPSLRNVALTAPYMHDGSLRTLRQVVEFYDRGGFTHEGIDPMIEPLDLTEQEISDLVAFLRSLTGDNIAELIRDARSERVGNAGS